MYIYHIYIMIYAYLCRCSSQSYRAGVQLAVNLLINVFVHIFCFLLLQSRAGHYSMTGGSIPSP